MILPHHTVAVMKAIYSPINRVILIGVMMARIVYADCGCRRMFVILHLVLLLCQHGSLAPSSEEPFLSIEVGYIVSVPDRIRVCDLGPVTSPPASREISQVVAILVHFPHPGNDRSDWQSRKILNLKEML